MYNWSIELFNIQITLILPILTTKINVAMNSASASLINGGNRPLNILAMMNHWDLIKRNPWCKNFSEENLVNGERSSLCLPVFQSDWLSGWRTLTFLWFSGPPVGSFIHFFRLFLSLFVRSFICSFRRCFIRYLVISFVSPFFVNFSIHFFIFSFPLSFLRSFPL